MHEKLRSGSLVGPGARVVLMILLGISFGGGKEFLNEKRYFILDLFLIFVQTNCDSVNANRRE